MLRFLAESKCPRDAATSGGMADHYRSVIDMSHRTILPRYRSIQGHECAYCAGPYEVRDHVLPAIYAASVNLTADERRLLVTVPACASCNSILGPRVFSTFSDRCQYVAGYLGKKHRKLLGAPDWTAAELSMLGQNLRGRVATQQQRKAEIARRIASALSRAEDTGFLTRDPETP